MGSVDPKPHIPESFFEHRPIFADPWIDRWVQPNPFLLALVPALRPVGVELSDYSFNNGANIGETYLNISIRKINAVVRIGLDAATFIVANPYWAMAPDLIPIFDGLSNKIRGVAGISSALPFRRHRARRRTLLEPLR